MLKVYLDTSDYARLYNPKEAVHKELAAELRALSKNPRVNFFYSAITIWEFIQEFDNEFFEDRVKRARFIHELCSSNAMRWFQDIARYGPVCKNGTWFPSEHPDIMTIERLVSVFQETALEHISISSLPRRDRRKLKTKAGVASLLPPNAWVKIYPTIEKEGTLLSSEFKTKNALGSYLLGRMSKKEASKLLRQSLTHLDLFLVSFYKGHKGTNWILDMVERLYEPMSMNLESFRQSQQNVDRLSRELGKLQQDLEKNLEELPASVKSAVLSKARSNAPNLQPVKMDIPLNSPIGRVAGPFAVKVINAYSTHMFKSNRNMRRSDFGDILHAAYIPHVDLWRGDKGFCKIIENVDPKFSGRLVSRLEELPDRIDDYLKS